MERGRGGRERKGGGEREGDKGRSHGEGELDLKNNNNNSVTHHTHPLLDAHAYTLSPQGGNRCLTPSSYVCALIYNEYSRLAPEIGRQHCSYFLRAVICICGPADSY